MALGPDFFVSEDFFMLRVFSCLLGLCLVSLAWVGSGESGVAEDRVVLLKGKPLVGRIVKVSDESLILRQRSRHRVVELKDVDSYVSVDEELSSVMPDLGAVSQSIETAGLAQLAKTCKDRGLPGESNLVWWNVLRLEPDNEEAHQALGHKKVKRGWKFRMAEQNVNMEKLSSLQPRWGKAFELSTTHFDVRSNMLWFDTVKAALMAEQIYVLIYHSLGSEFELYWPTERMVLHIHGDGSFPGGAQFKGQVDQQSHRATIDAEQGFQPWFLARHLSELILTEAIREEAEPTANFPMWMKIGMEEYMQAVLGFEQNEGSVIKFNPDSRHILNHETHRGAKKPFGVTRVLNFGDGDFKAEDNGLQRAQSYTLFNYCLNGEDGELNAKLQSFFRSIKEGKASSTDFKEAFGIRRKKAVQQFEKAWEASLR
ncbi:MAG: hypothetical protein ACI9X4_000300 [Glaciecola sp.]|jgi:hypothetical protein